MKNPNLFWLIAILAYSLTYSFMIDLHPEQLRYIEGAKEYGGNILTESGGFYDALHFIGERIGYENAMRLISFTLLFGFLLGAYKVMPEKAAILILMLFPLFPSLIYTQTKNLLMFMFFIAIYGKFWQNQLWKAAAFAISSFYATFYAIQAVIFLPFCLFFGDRMFEHKFPKANLSLLGLFVIMNIAYWGSLGFHQFETAIHEEVGLLNTVLFLTLICAFDWSLVGTVSLAMAIILFAIGEPYWAYRPLEVMAINAVVSNGTIILKTLSLFIPAWSRHTTSTDGRAPT